MKINKEKLTFAGSMNYILQIFYNKSLDIVKVDQYQPRKSKVLSFEMTKDELRPQVEETIERMKIAITQMQEYLDGKRDFVYYWQLDEEK